MSHAPIYPYETRRTWECYSILNDGDGERGQRVVVRFLHPVAAAEAAEAAAEEINEAELREQRLDCQECAFHRTSQVIEVVTATGPQRYRVSCRAKMEYAAKPEAQAKG